MVRGRLLGLSRDAQDVHYAERRERVRSLWPVMSVRDIAAELDSEANAVLNDARLLGLGSRPIARQP